MESIYTFITNITDSFSFSSNIEPLTPWELANQAYEKNIIDRENWDASYNKFINYSNWQKAKDYEDYRIWVDASKNYHTYTSFVKWNNYRIWDDASKNYHSYQKWKQDDDKYQKKLLWGKAKDRKIWVDRKAAYETWVAKNNLYQPYLTALRNYNEYLPEKTRYDNWIIYRDTWNNMIQNDTIPNEFSYLKK